MRVNGFLKIFKEFLVIHFLALKFSLFGKNKKKVLFLKRINVNIYQIFNDKINEENKYVRKDSNSELGLVGASEEALSEKIISEMQD